MLLPSGLGRRVFTNISQKLNFSQAPVSKTKFKSKLMKNLKLVFTALLLSAFIGNIQAQDTKTAVAPKHKPQTEAQKQQRKAKFDEMKQKLALTPQQEQSFKDINKKFHEEIKGVKTAEGDRTEKFGKIKAIRDRKDGEMKKILSEQQYKTYLEIQQERHQKMKDKRKEMKQTKE